MCKIVNKKPELGDCVRVAHYDGVIIEIIENVQVNNEVRGLLSFNLRSNLYRIAIDLSEKKKWVLRDCKRQLYIGDVKRSGGEMLLFADEFEVITEKK